MDPSLLQPFQGLLSKLLPSQSGLALTSETTPQSQPTSNPLEAGAQAFQAGMQQQGGNPLAAVPGAIGAAAQTAIGDITNAIVPPNPAQQQLADQQALERALSSQRQTDAIRAGSLLDENGQERANFRPESSGLSGIAQGVGQTFSDLGSNLQRPDLNPLQKLASIPGAAMQVGQEAVINPIAQGMQSALGAAVGTPWETDLSPEQHQFVNDVSQRQGPAAAWNAYWKIQELANPDSLYNKPIIKGLIESAPLMGLGETGTALRGVEAPGLAGTAARITGQAVGAADILAQGPLAVTNIPGLVAGLKEADAAQLTGDIVSRARQVTPDIAMSTEVADRVQQYTAKQQGLNLQRNPDYTMPGGLRLGNSVNLEPSEMRELLHQPYVKPFADIAQGAYKSVEDMVGWTLDHPSKFMGLSTSDEALGVNLRFPNRDIYEIWASPWAHLRQVMAMRMWDSDPYAGLANETVDTFMHEIAHNSERGHGNAFEDLLDRLYSQVGVQRISDLKENIAQQLRAAIPEESLGKMADDLERLRNAPHGSKSLTDNLAESGTTWDQLIADSAARTRSKGGGGLPKEPGEARNPPGGSVQPGEAGVGEPANNPPRGITAEGRLDPATLYEGQPVNIRGKASVLAKSEDTGQILEQDANGKQWLNVKGEDGTIQQYPFESAQVPISQLPESAAPKPQPATTPTQPQPIPPPTANLPRTPSPIRPLTGADGLPEPPVQALQKALHDAMYTPESGADTLKIKRLGTFVADADIMQDLQRAVDEGYTAKAWSSSWDKIAEEAATKLGFEDGEALAKHFADMPPDYLAALQVAGQALTARYAERLSALRYSLQNGVGDLAGTRRELEMTNAKYLQIVSALSRQSSEIGRGLGVMRRQVEMSQARDLARAWEARNTSVHEWIDAVRKARSLSKVGDDVIQQLRIARDQIDQWLKGYNQTSATPLMDQHIEMQVLGRDAKTGRYTKIAGQPEPTPDKTDVAARAWNDETRAIMGRKIDPKLYQQVQKLNESARHEAGLGLQANVDKLLQERDKIIEQMHTLARSQKMQPSTWSAIEKGLKPTINVMQPRTALQEAVERTQQSIDKFLRNANNTRQEIMVSDMHEVMEALGMLDKMTAQEARNYREKLGRAFWEGRIKGIDPKDLPDEVRNYLNSANFDTSNPRSVQTAVRMLGQAGMGKFDQYRLIRVASLLSDFATIFLHPTARAAWATFSPAIRAAEAAVEQPLAALQHRPPEATFSMAGRELKTMWSMHRASPEEAAAGHSIAGIGGAIPQALVQAIESWRTGTSAYNVLDSFAAKGGLITWLPFRPLNNVFRAMSAMNDFFQSLNTSMLLPAEAEREALHLANTKIPLKAQLRDDLYARADALNTDRQAYLQTYIYHHPYEFPEFLERVYKTSQERNLNEPLTGFWNNVRQSRANSAVSFLIPFFKISANVFRTGFRFTPWGLVEAKDAVKAGDLALAADRYGQVAFGSMLTLGAGIAAWNGILTGYGPSDPHKRDELIAQGWQPFSIHAAGGYTPYEKIFGPFGIPLIFATSLVDAMKEGMSTNEAMTALQAFVYDVGPFLASNSAIYSFKNIFDFMSDPVKQGQRTLQGIAGGMIPYVGLGHSIQRMIDPVERTPRGVVEYMLTQLPGLGALYEVGDIPGWHQDVPLSSNFPYLPTQPLDIRYGPTGTPEPRPGYGFVRNLTPLAPAKTSPEMPDEVIQEAQSQGATIAHPTKDVGRGPLKDKLSQTQFNAYDQLATQNTDAALKHLYQTDLYHEASQSGKAQLIADWTSISHRAAREQLGILTPEDTSDTIPLKYKGVTDRNMQVKIDDAISAYNAAKSGGPAPSEDQLKLVTTYGDPTMHTPEYQAYHEAQVAARSKAEGETAAILGGEQVTGPQRQSLINALQTHEQIKNLPRYINAAGQPVGNVQDWDRWDNIVKSFDSLTPQAKKSNLALSKQVNAIRAAQNPELVRLADTSLDYQRWFGYGQKLDAQKWSQLQGIPKFVKPGTQTPVSVSGRPSNAQDWATWTAYMAAYKKLPQGPAKTNATPTYRLLRRMLNPTWVNAIPTDNLYAAYGTDITNENAA